MLTWSKVSRLQLCLENGPLQVSSYKRTHGREGPKKGPRLVNWLSYTKIGVKVHSATGVPFEVSLTQPNSQIDSKKCSEIRFSQNNKLSLEEQGGIREIKKRASLHSYRFIIGQIYWPVFLKKRISLGSALRDYTWENSALQWKHILKATAEMSESKIQKLPSFPLVVLQLYMSTNWGFWDLKLEIL